MTFRRYAIKNLPISIGWIGILYLAYTGKFLYVGDFIRQCINFIKGLI